MSSTQFIVIGDLHYDPKYAHVFDQAFEQLKSYDAKALVQLGDVGGYHYPGSQQSFDDIKHLFSKLNIPTHTLMGNHDLEGEEFESDEANRQAWMKTFNRTTLWESFDIGPYLGISLSSWSFRDHPIVRTKSTWEKSSINGS